jgi:hypothetical protein
VGEEREEEGKDEEEEELEKAKTAGLWFSSSTWSSSSWWSWLLLRKTEVEQCTQHSFANVPPL